MRSAADRPASPPPGAPHAASPGSRAADAGIPHYWVIDIEDGVSLTPSHLAGEFGYLVASPLTGAVTIEEPFDLRLDLDALL
ncbi:MAG: hypothetical protein ACRDRZ_15810 [Pseudonocardiaceae bacterium]